MINKGIQELNNTGHAMENTFQGIITDRYVAEAVQLQTIENENDVDVSGGFLLARGVIHFYFCLEGMATFGFGPHYSREFHRDRSYFFYNPDQDLPFRLTLKGNTRLVYLSITLRELHDLFTHEAQALPILNKENASRKFYDEREVSAGLRVVLTSMFTTQLTPTTERLFFHGKVLELLSLYFSHRIPDTESCPFLNDQETVRKIRVAKEYLLGHLESPPGLKELAKISGLNEYQLKVGFKEVYGNTVYGYLLDHKLDQARLLLDSGKFQVNEVSYRIGYTNTSHFIAAFRKKFGVTPKKYLMNK